MEKDSEAQEKGKLKEQISRLKKIIRDMQIEKIKSIDLENDLGESGLLKKDSKVFSQKESKVDKEKDSISVFEGMQTQKKFWGKSRVDQVGRIIKNTQGDYDKEEFSPRRRSQNIKYYGNDDSVRMQPEDLAL